MTQRVAAVVVTRGDVDLSEILVSFPAEWERIVWTNGSADRAWSLNKFIPGEEAGGVGPPTAERHDVPVKPCIDLSVYGRYAAIEYTDAPIIYVQDDDCVLEPESFQTLLSAYQPGVVTANMPARFRHDFYVEHCLVGFGAIFDRDLPAQAFARYRVEIGGVPHGPDPFFDGHCDIVFTGLSTRHLVDVPHRDLDWASAPNRMWKQPNHQTSRSHMLKLVRQVRDA